MDIKNAVKTVTQEIKKLKTEVSNWHAKREEVFEEVKTSWKAEYERTLSTLKDNPESKKIVAALKSFEKFNDKTVQVNTKKLLVINNEYSLKIKELAKFFGTLAYPYLQTIKEVQFGVDVKAQDSIEQELTHLIADKCFKNFDAESLVNDLNKKLLVVTKDLNKPTSDQESHKKYMAKMEAFGTTMLSNIAKPLNLSKNTRQSLENNELLSPLLYELEASIYIEKIDQTLDDLINLNNSVHVDALVDSYGTAPDEASLKRSKSAMKGVREGFGYFKKYFRESTLEDIESGMDSMNTLYLNDMMDHLNLGKACLINDAVAMDRYSIMDTASRELMSDSLHEYLNSEKFCNEVNEQKKSKKKVKP